MPDSKRLAIILVVGYIVCSAVALMIPTSRRWLKTRLQRLRLTMLSEYGLFDSEQERDRAGKRAAKALFLRWRTWLFLLLLWVPAGTIGLALQSVAVRCTTTYSRGIFLVFYLGLVCVAPLLCQWVYMIRFMRAFLRKYLNEHGKPVCLKCGYDLRATPQRCPECGTENGAW